MHNWQDMQIFLEVVRSERLTDAARRLNIDHSTVSRRIRRFESQLNTQLFERSTHGYRLTDAGQQLLLFAERMERAATGALENISDHNLHLSGQVRLGVTEGFGTWVITPLLGAFSARYPELTIELLTLPRTVNLSRHEADLAITIDRPSNSEMVTSRLCEYRLRLYGQRAYLQSAEPLRRLEEINRYPLIGYVDDLIFSDQLCYLDPLLATQSGPPHFALRSTSVITQLHAARNGLGLAVLPCFMAQNDPLLQPLLCDEIDIVRQFWISARAEQRQLLKIRLLWQFLKEAIDENREFLLGVDETRLRLPGNGEVYSNE